MRELRAEDGGDIQGMGSPTLGGTLISDDLVDKYRLMIEPIVLGGGKRLFPDDGRARPLELVSNTTLARRLADVVEVEGDDLGAPRSFSGV